MILAHVVTKTTHEGAGVGYEGIDQRLSLGGDQTITMLVLVQVDRFSLYIGLRGVTRGDAPPRSPVCRST